MNQNPYFMGTPHNPRTRAPVNITSHIHHQHHEMHIRQTNHNQQIYGPVRIRNPMNRYHPPPYPHQNARHRQQFGGNGFRPYFRHAYDKQQWNAGGGPGGPPGPRQRFPIPSPHMPVNCNRSPPLSSEGFNSDRRRPFMPDQENMLDHQYHSNSQYMLQACVGIREQHEEFQRSRMSSQFAEVRASVNVTIRSGNYNYQIRRPGEEFRHDGSREGQVSSKQVRSSKIFNDFNGVGSIGTGGESSAWKSPVPVAVGSCGDPSTSPSSDSSEGNSPTMEEYSSESCTISSTPPENHENLCLTSQEEEYEPDNPEITTPFRTLTHKDITWSPTFSPIVDSEMDSSNVDQSKIALTACDDEGFHEAFVGVVIGRYPSELGRQVEVAGYGVYFADGSKRNFSGTLTEDRIQNLKAVMIYGSASAVDAMKSAGYSRVRVNLETEYLNKNVLGWISKYMDNPNAEPANWDEVKYHSEILELCTAAYGMIIKWSHCGGESVKKTGIEKAKQLAKKATDAWNKEFRLKRESVGTS